MIIYRITTYNNDGKGIHIYTTSARKAEEYLERYAHSPEYYGTHVFGQDVSERRFQEIKKDEDFI